MYYSTTTLPNTNSWQNISQVQNWQNQQNRNYASELAGNWAPGWSVVDVQDTGNQYKVHFRDNHGHYKTVFMDHSFRYQQTQDRYC